MKHILYFFAIAATIWSGCETKDKPAPGTFVVEAEILGVPDSVEIFLQLIEDRNLTSIDSANLINSKVTLSGNIASPQMAFINIGGSRKAINFFAESNNIQVRVHVDSLQDARVSGSKTHDDFMAFKAVMNPIDIRSEELNQEYSEASMTGDSEKMNAVISEYESLRTMHNQKIREFISQKKSSFIAPFIIREYLVYELEYAQLDSLLSSLDPVVHTSSDFEKLSDRAETLRKVAIGQPAVDFALNDPEGNPVAISSFRGNYLLIDFWASWCGPCRRENPNVVKLYQEFNPMGFEIIGVSFDRDRDQWLKAIVDDNLTWPHVSDLKYWDSEAGKLYAVNSIPATVLLDRQGIIIAKNLRGDALRKKLEELRAAEDQNI